MAKPNKPRADDMSTEGIAKLAKALEATSGCANKEQTDKTLDAHFPK